MSPLIKKEETHKNNDNKNDVEKNRINNDWYSLVVLYGISTLTSYINPIYV